jgi:nicotinamidase-related amidase
MPTSVPARAETAVAAVAATAEAAPASSLLTPDNCTLLLVDYEAQMFFGVQSHDRQTLINNTVGLARAAQVFQVPTVVTTVYEKWFSGPMPQELASLYPAEQVIDRSTMNPWEDDRVVRAVAATGRPKLVIGGLWTEVCVAMPALSALEQGYEVYVVVDACGGTSTEAHEAAVRRMVQAGVVPVTWLQVLLELQRDWARDATSAATRDVAIDHAGAYGQGSAYVGFMFAQQAAAQDTQGVVS